MSGRASTYLAWGLVGFAATATLAAWLISLDSARGIPDLAPVTLSWSFPIVGAVIATRHPRNPIGWVFIAAGFMMGTQGLANAYADETIRGGSTSMFPRLAYWYATWAWLPPLVLIAPYSLLLFPTGEYLSRAWRIVGNVAGMGLLLVLGGQGLRPWEDPGEFESVVEHGISNPFGLPVSTDVLEIPLIIGGVLLFGGMLAGAAGMVVRFRRARGTERQQLKWVTLAVMVAVATYLGADLLPGTRPDPFVAITLPMIPAAAGFAILRHRLYDIDIVINRTLVYGSLSGFLLTVYLSSVIAFQALLPAQGSDLAVAVSTLAVAGLFGPARKRIQTFIDRRFYRSRYDASLTLQAFSRRVRDEVNVDEIERDVLDAVSHSVQPAHLSLYLTPMSGGAS